MFDAVERTLFWFAGTLLEGDAEAHCQIRSRVDDTTFVTTSDDLMTVIEVLGGRKLIGLTEFERQTSTLAAKIAAHFKAGNGSQHSIGVSFRSSPEGVTALLDDMLSTSLDTARRYGCQEADMDYFRDLVDGLTRRCKDEAVYLVLLTHRSGLKPTEQKRAMEWREEVAARIAKSGAKGQPVLEEFSQTHRTPPPAVFPRHAAMVTNFVKDLKADSHAGGVELIVRLLDCGEATNKMRQMLEPKRVPSGWRARFIGDAGTAVAVNQPRSKDSSHLLPMRVGRQILTEGYKEIYGDAEIAKKGAWYHASLVMDMPPESGSAAFNDLCVRIGRQIPWGCSFEVTPNGLKTRGLDQFYSGIVGGLGEYNKAINAGWKALRDMQKDGAYVGALRAVFTTWAKTERDVVENLSFLRSSLESWDSSVVTNETGGPALAAMCAAAGLTKRSPAPYIPAPMTDIARMLPMFRPASVWRRGQFLGHTMDGRPYPVAFGSSEQAFWGTLIFAPSGSGKSFLMNLLNFGILFSPGQENLPYLVVIDVGPSSKLVMDLVRAMLPDRLRRQVQSLRIRNSPEYAVNPFDTQHGCDKPSQVDKDFLVSVISTLVPSLGPEGEKLIGLVIDETYEMLGRSSPQCRNWESSLDPELHAKLEKMGYEFTDRTRVWDIVDFLFDRGEIEDSASAQRYAVPVLGDLIRAVSSPRIRDQYGEARVNGDLMLKIFSRNIIAAQSEYRLISGVTKFDLGSARAISIDLEEVVGAMTTDEGRRRSSMMFLFARRLGARNFFLRWDELKEIVPPRFAAYQEARIKKIQEEFKFLEYDEKHYTTGIEAIDRQLGVDLRVGRKYKTVTVMASQLLADFPRDTVDNCYTKLVLGLGSNTSASELQERFSLSQSEMTFISSFCVGPGTFFGMFKTKEGDTSQIIRSAAGPFMMWAFTTNPDDALIREELARRMGGEVDGRLPALRMLAHQFPEGNAERGLNRLKQAMGTRGAVSAADVMNLTAAMCDRILAQAQKDGMATE